MFLRARAYRPATLVIVVAVIAGCAPSDTYKQHLTELPSLTLERKHDKPFELRGAVEMWHMKPDDIRCFEAEALANPETHTYGWTADELNGYADTCNIEISDLWIEVARYN